MSENMKNKHICVILSGCGFLDGAEIQEAVCSLLYISQNGSTYEVVAPNKDQHHVVNHHTGEESQEQKCSCRGCSYCPWVRQRPQRR